MVCSSSSNFVDVVTIRERIENGMKSKKIGGNATQQTIVKRPHGSFSNKKEG